MRRFGAFPFDDLNRWRSRQIRVISNLEELLRHPLEKQVLCEQQLLLKLAVITFAPLAPQRLGDTDVLTGAGEGDAAGHKIGDPIDARFISKITALALEHMSGKACS